MQEKDPMFGRSYHPLRGWWNARRHELVEWLGDSFDPKLFELNEANEHLAEYAEVARG